ncbi:RNA-directed DNA polymerase from mobile element jockey [Plakobranchus ocellatus]|uniref:RNA-directed DNA polymerase from mobile element jockey n=1 Tax=Plakobranchus ocellatus TaxID=259542 RepID=A0AAV3ZVF6_9GAST|nr:RNA-directed DNA polymerase from mobile element jockey [Plakobranchus ocellatus]
MCSTLAAAGLKRRTRQIVAYGLPLVQDKGQVAHFYFQISKRPPFKVKAENTFCSSYPQENGVPQGSILSPMLFDLKINNIINSVSKNVTYWGADGATLLKLYRTLVRSKLDYGSVVYGSAKKHVLRALDPIHHQGLRISLGAFRTSPIKSLYAEAG